MSMLVLPYLNAEVERTFSQLKILKSKLRNKMKPETRNAIFVVRAGLKRQPKRCLITKFPRQFLVPSGHLQRMCNQVSFLVPEQVPEQVPVEMISYDDSGDEDLDVFFVDL
ncbi:hypothetical protein HPB48_004513 [Haemaphysalis longicornis]|uniref:HAT C-terminal dimerisation domain-containing protein n=1 Tax=Haemaphysalis longicornis TaxID=44386 RepID=A0A9J6G0T4_HAELO|nr:hypothetical protein HPB48_004513 [Haemaphysalis longicornis]